MPGNINRNILLVGAGPMALEHYKVLRDLHCNITVVGRGETAAKNFYDSTGVIAHAGGIGQFLAGNKIIFDSAVIAVGVDHLFEIAFLLLKNDFKKILVEKPGGINLEEIRKLKDLSEIQNAFVYLGYNRRFYASVLKAREIIEQDGGVLSFNFEFTEWSHKITGLNIADKIKANWFLANSSHVVDLAFYLGGKPKEISCYTAKELEWHKPVIFAGSGISENGALFNYQANWLSPGRWGVEVLTKQYRLIFRPLESLQYQKTGSVEIEKMDHIDYSLDEKYKAGLYKQAIAFLGGANDLITIQDQYNNMAWYSKINMYESFGN